MLIEFRIKAIKIVGKRNTFCKQKIPASSCARKETVHKVTLVISKNGDRKIYQPIRITSGPPKKVRKLILSQRFKESGNCATNSPTYPFL